MRAYAVVAAAAVLAGLAFATPVTTTTEVAPAGNATTTGDVVVAAAGDIVCAPSNPGFDGSIPGRCQHRATAQVIANSVAQAVLTLGDNQYENGSLANYQTAYDPSWGAFNTMVHPVPGNHEYQTAGAAGYFDYFTAEGVSVGTRSQGYYSYDLGTWHLIALNSNCSVVPCRSTSAQVAWLRSDLAATTQPCVLAYWHHPRFSSGLHGDIANVGPFWTELYRARADVVLAGHDHDYERYRLQDPSGRATGTGLREFVIGTGGASLYNFSTADPNSVKRIKSFGVLLLTLRADSYSWRFVNAAGVTSDTGSTTCH
jgi:hypothetical protein